MQVEDLHIRRSLWAIFCNFCGSNRFWGFWYRLPILVVFLLCIFRLLFLLYFLVNLFRWCFSLILLGWDGTVRWGFLENAPFIAAKAWIYPSHFRSFAYWECAAFGLVF